MGARMYPLDILNMSILQDTPSSLFFSFLQIWKKAEIAMLRAELNFMLKFRKLDNFSYSYKNVCTLPIRYAQCLQ